MCELLSDHVGYHLDGVSVMSLTDFETGFIEKIYEKQDNVLRHERRVVGDIPVNTVTSFLLGGLSSSREVSRLEAVESAVRDTQTAMKHIFSQMFDFTNQVKKMNASYSLIKQVYQSTTGFSIRPSS